MTKKFPNLPSHPERVWAWYLWRHHLVAQVQSPAEGPGNLELADGAAGVAHQPDGMVFRVDGLHLRIGPTHDLHRAHVLADVVARNFHAVAAQIEDGAAARLGLVPKPVGVRAGVRFAGPRPQDFAECPALDGFQRFQELGRVAQVLQVAGKNARLFHRFQHLQTFLGVASERFGGHHGLFVFGTGQHRRQVQVVGQRNAYDVHVLPLDGGLHIGRPERHIVVGCEFAG